MSETYDVDEYISPETGEIKSDPEQDVTRKRTIISVDEARTEEKKQVTPQKKEAVKKQVPEKSDGKKPSPRLRRATRPSARKIQGARATSANTDIKKFTILIPDDLLRKFRIQALQDGMTYSALGVEAVQSLLKARKSAPPQAQ